MKTNNHKPHRTGKTLTDYTRGVRDGDEHARNTPLADLSHGPFRVILRRGHDKRRPWRFVLNHPTLAEHLQSQGKHYANGYCDALARYHDLACRVRKHLRTNQGFHDGCRWATGYSTPDLHTSFLRAMELYGGEPPILNTEYDVWSPTVSHALLVHLYDGQYPTEEPIEDPEIEVRGGPILDAVFDCPQFRDFWAPFVSEDMDEYMEILRASVEGDYKLNDSNYIRGFILGAVATNLQIACTRQDAAS